jgi:RNA polymerase sigma-70 factor (ECF subfamily)
LICAIGFSLSVQGAAPGPAGGSAAARPQATPILHSFDDFATGFHKRDGRAKLPDVVEDDAVVLARVLAGDEDAFAGLVRRYEPRLRLYVTHIVGVAEEARDLVQESFIRVWRNLDQYDSRYRFSTWLFRIAHNLAIDHVRRRRQPIVSLDLGENDEGEAMRLDPADERPNPLANFENRELARSLAREIRDLPPAYRELVTLRHLVGLSYAEIAELKKLPLGTVKNKLFRAHSVLRVALASYLGTADSRQGQAEPEPE